MLSNVLFHLGVCSLISKVNKIFKSERNFSIANERLIIININRIIVVRLKGKLANCVLNNFYFVIFLYLFFYIFISLYLYNFKRLKTQIRQPGNKKQYKKNTMKRLYSYVNKNSDKDKINIENLRKSNEIIVVEVNS